MDFSAVFLTQRNLKIKTVVSLQAQGSWCSTVEVAGVCVGILSYLQAVGQKKKPNWRVKTMAWSGEEWLRIKIIFFFFHSSLSLHQPLGTAREGWKSPALLSSRLCSGSCIETQRRVEGVLVKGEPTSPVVFVWPSWKTNPLRYLVAFLIYWSHLWRLALPSPMKTRFLSTIHLSLWGCCEVQNWIRYSDTSFLPEHPLFSCSFPLLYSFPQVFYRSFLQFAIEL